MWMLDPFLWGSGIWGSDVKSLSDISIYFMRMVLSQRAASGLSQCLALKDLASVHFYFAMFINYKPSRQCIERRIA